MAIEVVSRPEKTLENGYLSRWNASKTPLIYKLSSNRFPTNNLDITGTITQYFYSLSEGGIVIADPGASSFIGVSFVKISGTQFIDGIYKILRVIGGSFVIDGFTNESEGGQGVNVGFAQTYYKGYKGLVKVFVGSPEYHPYNANGTKPQIEIGTIDVDFNSDNIGVCNVRSYIKPDLMAKFSDLQNNPNLWTSFSIEYAEIWEGSGEAVYEEDLIDGCNPFFGLFNTDFDDGLDDWDQVAPSGSGTFSQWVVGLPPFRATFNIASNGETLTLPTPTNYVVDWGDGTTSNNTNQHTYTSLGVYAVEIPGIINDFQFNDGGDKDKILTVEEFGGLQLRDESFNGCSNLDITATDVPSVFGANLLAAFSRCPSLVYNSSINQIDLSGVTFLNEIFNSTTSFNQDISGWNVSSVENMNGMFREATSFNQDISGWNVSNVKNMNGMFIKATSFNSDLSTWNVGSVENMASMFSSATSFNQDISGWNVSSVENMREMFREATSFNQDLPLWNVSSVENMNLMFFGAISFNGDISGWNVSSVTSMQSMFIKATSFNSDLSTWNVGSVISMDSMFREAPSFNGDISGWNVSNVKNMNGMFREATSFNQDISSWNFTSVENMNGIMTAKSDANYNSDYLSNLFIKLDQDLVFANMTNVNLGFGSIKYDSTGVAAYNSLISKGFIIQSGGQV